MDSQMTKGSIGRMISLIAALVTLLCFFMPWVEIGVSFVKTSVTGYQLATGSGPAGLSMPSWSSLLLVPAAMLAVMAVVVVAVTYFYFNLNAEFNRNVLTVLAQSLVSYTFGWGATLASSVAVLAGGLFDLRSASGQPRRMAAGGF